MVVLGDTRNIVFLERTLFPSFVEFFSPYVVPYKPASNLNANRLFFLAPGCQPMRKSTGRKVAEPLGEGVLPSSVRPQKSFLFKFSGKENLKRTVNQIASVKSN